MRPWGRAKPAVISVPLRIKRPAPGVLLVMNLGVVGLITFWVFGIGIIPSILALVLAPRALRRIKEDPAHLTGETLVAIGRTLAIMALAFAGAAILILISDVISHKA